MFTHGLLGSFLYLTPAQDSRCGPVNLGRTVRRDGQFEPFHPCITGGSWALTISKDEGVMDQKCE